MENKETLLPPKGDQLNPAGGHELAYKTSAAQQSKSEGNTGKPHIYFETGRSPRAHWFSTDLSQQNQSLIAGGKKGKIRGKGMSENRWKNRKKN